MVRSRGNIEGNSWLAYGATEVMQQSQTVTGSNNTKRITSATFPLTCMHADTALFEVAFPIIAAWRGVKIVVGRDA